MNGMGKYFFPNGNSFVGFFRENKREGFGRFRLKDSHLNIVQIESIFKDNELSQILRISLGDSHQKNLNFVAIRNQLFERNSLKKAGEFEWKTEHVISKKLKQKMYALNSFEKRLSRRTKVKGKEYISSDEDPEDEPALPASKTSPHSDSSDSKNSLDSPNFYSKRGYARSEGSSRTDDSDSEPELDASKLRSSSSFNIKCPNLKCPEKEYATHLLETQNYFGKHYMQVQGRKEEFVIRPFAKNENMLEKLIQRAENNGSRLGEPGVFPKELDLERLIKEIGIKSIDDASKQKFGEVL